jgi:predicted metal-dependent hydrolase
MQIEVTQLVRSKRRTIALIVKPDGSVIVRAPMRAPMTSIREFVEKNAKWIEKKRAEAQAFTRPKPKRYVPGESFLFLGTLYPLKIVKGQKAGLVLEEGTFKLADSAQRNAALVFERWYRREAMHILKKRVEHYASQFGFQYRKIGVTSARTRWGSCSASGALNFSWRLILAPQEVVDYVVVHELVHTQIHNHSKQFWKRVATIMPEYEERRKWLRKNGHPLLV